MNIAVTGASGSIGKELVPFIVNLGHKVFTISSSVTGNGKSIFSYEDLKCKDLDISIDIFIHLASLNSSLDLDSAEQEARLTRDILESLPSLDCSKLIFFSSGKVYGDNSKSKVIYDESSSLQPICSYGKAKKICEDLIFTTSDNLFNAIVLRLPPVLNQSHSSNVGKLIKLSRLGIPIPIFQDGLSNQRSFISFNNIKAVIEHLLNNPAFIDENKIYNLSDNHFISLSGLLKSSGKGLIFTLPKLFSNLMLRIPFLQGIFIKLYGNFVLDNTKIKLEMGVKLKSTSESMLTLYL